MNFRQRGGVLQTAQDRQCDHPVFVVERAKLGKVTAAAGDRPDGVRQCVPAVVGGRPQQRVELGAPITIVQILNRLADEGGVSPDDLLVAVGYRHACGQWVRHARSLPAAASGGSSDRVAQFGE